MRLLIYLSNQEEQLLRSMADEEVRNIRDQVIYIIREELYRRGLLSHPDGHIEKDPERSSIQMDLNRL